MKQKDILPTLNGEHGDKAQVRLLKHVISSMIERAYACYRVVGGGIVAVSSGPGKHAIHSHDTRTRRRR